MDKVIEDWMNSVQNEAYFCRFQASRSGELAETPPLSIRSNVDWKRLGGYEEEFLDVCEITEKGEDNEPVGAEPALS